jgi:hypothetical protein
MLSSEALEGLVTSTTFTYRMGDTARRAGAREAVEAAAKELGLDPLAPTLPRFAAGENVLRAAALRVLTVPGLEKTLERHRARVAAARSAADRLAELEHRRRELELVERARINDQIMAGKTPGPAPAEAIAELQRLGAELALAGGAGHVRASVPADERALILEAILTPAAIGSVVFYGALVGERLRVLTEDEPYNSPAARTAKGAHAEVTSLIKPLSYRKQDHELYRTGRAVRAAVELADLYLLHEKHDLTIDELDAAKGPKPARASA